MPEIKDNMPEVGEYKRDHRLRDSWWTLCEKCGQGFWNYGGFPTCVICFNKPGSLYTVPNGHVYLKIADNDPYYEMTMKSLGTLGSGWISESRYTMARHLGRILEKHERVYHKTSNLADNRLENLTMKMPKRQIRGMVARKCS